MTALSFSVDLSKNQVADAGHVGDGLATIGNDGVRIVSGLAPSYALGRSATKHGYSAFYNDAYTNGIINAIEGYAPQTMTTVQYLLHLEAGETVSFDYDYIPGDTKNNDFAFALFANAAGTVTPVFLADVDAWKAAGHATHYAGTTFTAGATGDYKLLIASADVGDTKGPSALILHSLTLQIPFGSFKILPTGIQLTADNTLLPTSLLTPGSQGTVSVLQSALANNLISQDGGGLISQDGGGFKLSNGLALISQDGGGLVAQGAGNLVAQGAGNLVASGAGNLVLGANDQAALLLQGSGFNGQQAAQLISQDGGGVVSNDGGSIVSHDASGLISQDGGGLISQDGGGLVARALIAVAPPPPVFDDSPDLGTEILISPAANLALSQDNPVVTALTNGKFVVAWVKTALNGTVSVRAQMYNADRSKFGLEIAPGVGIGLGQFQPTVVAIADGGFGIAWSVVSNEGSTNGSTATDIATTFYDATGSAIRSTPISGTGNQNQPAFAALPDGGAVLTWRNDGSTPGTTTLENLYFDRTGAATSGFSATLSGGNASQSANPAAAVLTSGVYAVAYADINTAASTDHDGVFVQLIANGLDKVVQVNTTATGVQHLPAIAALANGNFVVAWVDEGTATGANPVATLRAQVMDPTGAKVGTEITVPGNVTSQSHPPSLTALADGRFLVGWEQGNVSSGTVVSTSVRAAAYNADGTVSTATFAAAVGGTNVTQPSSAQLADGTVVVASVHAQGTSSDVRIEPLVFAGPAPLQPPVAGTEFVVGAAATAGVDLRASVVAGLSNGKSVVVWQSNPKTNSGGEFGIQGQLLNADGSVSGAVFTVVSPTAGLPKTDPTVTGLPGGGFVVGWTDKQFENDANGNSTRATDIKAKIFDASAQAVGSAFTVNTTVVRNQVAPNIASLQGGGFVALWATSFNSTSSTNVAGQRFAADGSKVGTEFTAGVASGVTSASVPVAAGLNTGGFVAVYYGKGATAATTGLYAQVYGANGAGGTPFLIQANALQQFAAVASLSNGNFVVTWADGANNGSSATGIVGPVRAQVFTGAGAALGAAFTVSQGADVATDAPAITALADGRFMIVYDSYSAATNAESARARLFNPDGTVSGAEFAASTVNGSIRASHPAVTQLANGALEVVTTQGNGGAAENSTFLGSDFFSSTIHVNTFTIAPPPAAATLRQGQVVDGFIKGATVFADANGDGLLTPGEQTAVTGSRGEFFFTSAAKGPIIAIGGTDVSTGLAFAGTLTAPAGSTSVSAVTTLVQKIMAANGGNQAAASAAVTAALGLPADTQLTTISPVDATLASSPTATQLYLANATLFNTIALATAAGATGDLLGKVATTIAAAPAQAYDPTTVASLQGLGLSGTVATSTAAIATSSKTLLATKLAANAGNPAGLIADVTAVETTVQGPASTNLTAAVATGTTASVANTYSGNNLTAIAGAQASTTAGNPPKFSYTDVVDSSVGYDPGTVYSGPVDYLRQQYIWSGSHSVAISAATPNAFLKGGPGGDALLAKGGQNVLDGGGGSNFLIGGDGSDGGKDVFFVDSRDRLETWSTIVNFHKGDLATIFGFHAGLSTRPYTDVDGAVGYTGVTIHSEIDGPGTGIKGSMTFAGIDRATADGHFEITTGTLAGSIDYMLIEYK